MLYLSIAFWVTVAYIAWKPQTTELPAMGPVVVRRAYRNGEPVTSPTAPVMASVVVETRPMLDASPSRRTLLHRPVRRALPPGATAMPGRVAARPMPSRFE